jgi:hypothetical protein
MAAHGTMPGPILTQWERTAGKIIQGLDCTLSPRTSTLPGRPLRRVHGNSASFACHSLLLKFFVKTNGHFATPSEAHQLVRLRDIGQREPVRNQIGRMQLPPHEPLH